MTPITLPRATVEQALEALEMCRLNGSQYLYGNERDLIFSAIKALRAALAQRAEPVQESSAYSKDWCLRMAQIEMDAGAEFEIGPDLAQQAEPVEPMASKRDTVCALCAREIALEAEAAPFGCVTVRRLSLRHENHADQYQFYPAGQSPYLDNVDECHTVYIIPPQRKPLTEEEIERIWRDGGWAGRPSIGLIRAVERAHGITGDNNG